MNETEDQTFNRLFDAANYAWFRLTRLSGCNYKVPISRRTAASVTFIDPQDPDRHYRIPAAKYDAGGFSHRNSWAITRWNEQAARVTEDERNWQT